MSVMDTFNELAKDGYGVIRFDNSKDDPFLVFFGKHGWGVHTGGKRIDFDKETARILGEHLRNTYDNFVFDEKDLWLKRAVENCDR
jgi:hypothetical protein